MRRRVPPAPHGFDINSRVSFLLGFYVLFAARIPDTGHFCPREHNRRAAGGRPLTGFPGVLLITTQGRPPRLMCGATGVSLYFRPPCRGETVCRTAFKAKEVARCKRNTANGQRAAAGHPPQVMALSPVSLAGAGMYLLCWIFDCQGAESCRYGCFRAKASRMLWRIQCISAGCEGRRSRSVFSCSLVKYLKVFVGSRAR